MSMTQHTIWYKGAPPMDGGRYLLCFKGSTDSDDIICTGSYRYGRPYNEPAPNTKAWRCDCCGKFSDPSYWAEIPNMKIDFSSYKNGLTCFVGNSTPVDPIFTDEEAMEMIRVLQEKGYDPNEVYKAMMEVTE